MVLSVDARLGRALRLVISLLVIAMVTVGGLAVSGGIASAHTGFSGSTPSDGDAVDEPVELISLVFTGEAEEAGDGFVVRDADGQIREPTSVLVSPDKKVFTLSFDPALAGGEIGVRWSVRAPDTHPIEGAFSFTVTAPVEETVASSTATPTSTTPATAAPATAAPGSDAAAPTTSTPAAVAVADDQGDTSDSGTASAEVTTLDEFLVVDGSQPGELQATLGRLLNFAGIALAIGGIVFAATTLRGERSEIRWLINAIRIVGGVIVVGAAIEYSGVARIAGESVSGYWSSSPGFAAVLRMLAGVAIAAGLAVTTVSIRTARTLSSAANGSAGTGGMKRFRRGASSAAPPPRGLARGGSETPYEPTSGIRILPRERAAALGDPGLAIASEQATADSVDTDDADTRQAARTVAPQPSVPERDHRDVDGRDERWVPTRASAVAFAGCVLAVVSFWFDGHTVSKGLRPLHAIANSVHVVAGSVWMGGVVAMTVLIWQRYRRGAPPRALELVVRFSQIAAVALAAVVVAGVVMAFSVLDSFGDLTGTEWGQLLLLKSGAAVFAMLGGAYNHFRLIPALDADPDNPALHERLRSVVTAEAILLGFVIVVTAWLVAAAS